MKKKKQRDWDITYVRGGRSGEVEVEEERTTRMTMQKKQTASLTPGGAFETGDIGRKIPWKTLKGS